MPCVSNPDLGGMKVTRESQHHSKFGRHTPRFMVFFFSVHTFGNKTDMILQSHVKAKKYMVKLFPLYDDLAALCDVVIATRVGTFRGTCDGSTDCDVRAQRMMKTGWFGSLQRRRAWIFDTQ